MTSSAADVLADIREQQGVPEGFVVRLSPTSTPDGMTIQVNFAPVPAESDQIVQTEPTTLCVDAELAEPLADTVIDAEQTPQGTALVLRS